LAKVPDDSDIHKAAAHFLAAMALQRDGQKEEAAKALEDALRLSKTVQAQKLPWVDRAFLDLLRREAEELCTPKKAPN
jgi:hypothetical protein